MKSLNRLTIVVALAAILGGCQSQETKLQNEVVQLLNNRKQELFNAFHPYGTAKSVSVHSVRASGNAIDVSCTVYWQGPITKDGYTKLLMHYDTDVQRWTDGRIEVTNGITRAEADEAAFNFGYALGRNL